MKGLEIAIVGCGSAGPAAAALLADAGHRPLLLERAPDLGPVGAGFLLQPTGLSVLERLGVRETVLERGARVERLHAVTTRGRTLLDLAYAELAPALFGLGLHRASLLDALAGALTTRRVPLRCGVEIDTVERDPGGRPLLRSAGGERLGPFDLLVLADGARSGLREQLGLPVRCREYPWGALWHIAGDPDGRFAGRLFQAVEGAERMLGFLPTGHLPDDAAPLVSLFWSVAIAEAGAWLEPGLERFRAEASRLAPQAADWIDAVREPEQLVLARYFDVVMPRWHGERVVVLGDAAHAMSPQLGQGVNLALADAAALTHALGESARLDDALPRYDRARRPALAFYQRATRWLTPFFQSSHASLAALRDASFPLARALPPLRRQMIRTMAGVKRGVLRRSLPVDSLG